MARDCQAYQTVEVATFQPKAIAERFEHSLAKAPPRVTLLVNRIKDRLHIEGRRVRVLMAGVSLPGAVP